MALMKQHRIEPDHWRHTPDAEPLGQGIAQTVSLERWLAQAEALAGAGGLLGVRLQASDSVEALAASLPRIALVVLELTRFTDGRAFSQARLLRERLGFRGEIRVRGDFLSDQIQSFLRAGVDSFELHDRIEPEEALRAAATYSVHYQPGAVSAAAWPARRGDGQLALH